MTDASTPRKRAGVSPWAFYLGDMGLTALALWLAEIIRRAVPLGREILPGTVYLTPAIFVLVIGVWSVVFLFFGVYSASPRRRAMDEIRALVSATAVAVLLFAGAIFFTRTRDFSRLLTTYFFALDLGFLIGWRWLVKVGMALLHANSPAHPRALVVGNGPTAVEVARRIQAHPWAGLQLAGFLRDNHSLHCQEHSSQSTLGDLDELAQVVRDQAIGCVVLALSIEQAGLVSSLILELQDLPVQVYVVPDYVGVVSLAPTVEDLYGIPLIEIADLKISGINCILKRSMDIAIALLAFPFALPVGLAIAIAIRLDSPGPVFFAQQRVGQNGRVFKMYKFRSMVANAPALLHDVLRERSLDAAPLKIKADPRVTRVGQVLRRTSLDELPQLLNVIAGDMSMVGPRPEEPRIVETYDAWQRKRLSVKPGVTGPMQVNGRGDLALDDRVRLELDYIQRYSLLEDVWLLLKTLPAIISGKGSY